MPGGTRAIVADAERRFPVRIAISLPPGGIGRLYKPMTDWLDDNCGINGWSMAPTGVRGVVDDAVAVYVGTPTCAVAFVARCAFPVTRRGFYDLLRDDPERGVPIEAHSTSGSR